MCRFLSNTQVWNMVAQCTHCPLTLLVICERSTFRINIQSWTLASQCTQQLTVKAT